MESKFVENWKNLISETEEQLQKYESTSDPSHELKCVIFNYFLVDFDSYLSYCLVVCPFF